MGSPQRAGSVVLVALALVIAPAAGCSSGDDPFGPHWTMVMPGVLLPPTDIDTVLATHWSDFGDRVRAVIRTEDEWAELWDQVHENVSPSPVRPDVDLTASMVVLASMGPRPTTGYSIVIRAITRHGDDLYVAVEERSPGRGCRGGDAITSPLVVVKVPAAAGDVTFLERTRRRSC